MEPIADHQEKKEYERKLKKKEREIEREQQEKEDAPERYRSILPCGSGVDLGVTIYIGKARVKLNQHIFWVQS